MRMLKERQKNRRKKGFTLMEMLIVVAIIAILVAIAIPTFSSQLNKAKAGADEANLRAAKSQAVVTYLLEENTTGSVTYNVFIDGNGNLKLLKDTEGATIPTGYSPITPSSSTYSGGALAVTVSNGEVTSVTWSKTS